MSLDFRPLTLGELFDRAFVLYRRHFWLFVGIVAAPAVFALLITLAQHGIQRVSLQPVDPESPAFDAQMIGLIWMFGGMLVALAAYLIMYMVALGATTFAVSEIYLGRSTTIRDSYRRMRGRIGKLVALMLLIGIRMVGIVFVTVLFISIGFVFGPLLGGLLAFVLAVAGFTVFVLLSLRYAVSVPALVLEGHSASNAIRRSVELTRGRLGQVFLLMLCATLVSYAALILFQGPFFAASMLAGLESATGMWLSVAGAVFGTIGSTLTAPFMIIGLALMYYDARIREEGFDLELTLSAIENAPAPASA